MNSLEASSIKQSPHISVLIVNYNGGAWLQRSVDSVAAQDFTDFECLIVDNASTDGSAQSLTLPDKRFQLIQQSTNTGFAVANNHAAKMAKGKWLALLNPDAFAAPDWLTQLLAATTRWEDVAMVGSLQRMALEDGILDGAGDFYHITGLAWRAKFGHSEGAPLGDYDAFGPCAAAALYKADLFHTVGGFDERFFCYHEDVDLAFRMRLAGGRCVQTDKAVVDHVSSGISGRASDFAVYHGTRNRIWTFFKNMPFALLVLLLPAHIAVNLAFLGWSLFRKGRFKPTFKGVRDGVLGLGSVWKQRKAVHSARTLSSWQLMKQLAWSPRNVVKRDIPSLPALTKKK